MNSFGPVARHYDVLMSAVPYSMWASYYLMHLERMDANPKRILDVCCGTGTLTEILAKRGYQLTGLDLSEAMIKEAREKAKRHNLPIHYEVADATGFDLGTKFDAAYSFFDSLNYITTAEGIRDAIFCVSQHLTPGSSFIFDLNTAYAFEKKMFDQRNMKRDSEIRYKWTGDYDPTTKLICVTMEFWTNDGNFVETHVQRAHADHEVRLFLAEAGFDDVLAYNSYTLDPPHKKSDRVHYVCTMR